MLLEDLDEEDYEIAIKVVVVGNGAVGKSSMIQRYCKGHFTNNYKKTIGVDFLEKHITASGEDVRLMLWDTAGQEEFDAITKAYYRGAQACVVAFSTTDPASFDAVKKWKRKVEDECGHIPMVLVQNKIDLLHESTVDSNDIDKFVRNTGLKLFRTSVKEDINVRSIFHYLAERHIEAVSRWSDDLVDIDVRHIEFNVNDHKIPRDTRVRFANCVDRQEKERSKAAKSRRKPTLSEGYYYPERQLPILLGFKSKSKKKQKQKQYEPHHPVPLQHFQHFRTASQMKPPQGIDYSTIHICQTFQQVNSNKLSSCRIL